MISRPFCVVYSSGAAPSLPISVIRAICARRVLLNARANVLGAKRRVDDMVAMDGWMADCWFCCGRGGIA